MWVLAGFFTFSL